jgi:beta-lactamase superfamily II metal-dependent hydrolase
MNSTRLTLILFILFNLAAVLAATSRAAPNGILQVSFINVGQGDAALLRDPGGYAVLIDGGKASAAPTVVAYLHEQGVDDLEAVVVTHGDSDHAGG